MPKRTDIHKILIIGSGPIVISQACEFDYSGVQACKALREEGFEVVLINSNPATIMTGPGTADCTYIEPITVEVLEKIIKKFPNIKIKVLKTKYPQGSEKQLIKVVLDREVPPEGLPLDVGCVVQNVGTALSIYEALYKGKALYERVVTISGDCIKEPSNLLARIGTPIRELVDQCKGFKKEPSKVIVGGPMMGITQFRLDAPIIKGTTGIIFLSSEAVKEYPETNCIRCARCVDTCPVNLVPADILRFVKKAKYQSLSDYNITDCIECGCCSYECPSKIPLVQWIKLGKSEYLKLKGPKAK